MPDWKMHLRCAEQVAEKINISNIDEFFLGNIVPDTPWINRAEANMEGSIKCKLHYYTLERGSASATPNYLKFLKENLGFIADTCIGKGMLLHLVLDYVVNRKFNERVKEVDKDMFDILLNDGTTIRVSGHGNRIAEKYKDIHSYEDTFTVVNIYHGYMSDDTMTFLKSLGYEGDIKNLINIITKAVSVQYYTDSAIFTHEEYEQMIGVSKLLFLELVKSNGL